MLLAADRLGSPQAIRTGPQVNIRYDLGSHLLDFAEFSKEVAKNFVTLKTVSQCHSDAAERRICFDTLKAHPLTEKSTFAIAQDDAGAIFRLDIADVEERG